MREPKLFWEIFVPRNSNSGLEYSVEHHKIWDEKVRAIAGGLTILKSAKGHWISREGDAYIEEMIPVQIYCTESQIEGIARETLNHYDQQEVMTRIISEKIKIIRRDDKP